MESWTVNVENYITVIYPLTSTLQAFYAKPEDAYVQISGLLTDTNDGRYFIKHTFTSTGTYAIKIVDTNDSDNTVVSSIDVVEAEEYVPLSESDKQDVADKSAISVWNHTQ
jgi:hypothetical protein